MINLIPLTIESLVSVLLLLTILYCVRLNSQIKRLKADESAMRNTVAELVAATDTAERAIAGLRATVRETDETLGAKLDEAKRFNAEMVINTESGHEVLARLIQIVGAARAQQPDEVKPANDPMAIVAAAQALTERAKARIRGLAA